MGYIVVDTCVWINLARTPPNRPLLTELAKYASPPPHRLVVPDSVRIEFSRHREQTSKDWVNSLDGHVKGLTHVRRAVDGLEGEIARIEEVARKAMATGGAAVRQNLDDVDRLFAMAQTWKAAPYHHKDTCERCIQLRAPAHRSSRTSVGDCLLWNTVVDLLDSACVWFCTDNKSDFSDDKRQDILHPALVEELKAKKHQLHYYINPTRMLEDLRELRAQETPVKPTQVEQLPPYLNVEPGPPGVCPRCGGTRFNSGAYLRSQYGGLTLQFVCLACGFHYDTGEFWE